MPNKQTNNILIIVGFTLAVFLIFTIGGLFSVISQEPTCTIPADGGTCTINITVPQDRAMTNYDLLLQLDKVPENNYSDYQSITHSSASARLLEEKTDRDPREYDWETVYMYTIPEQDVFAISVKAEATGTATSTSTGINARGKIGLYGISSRYQMNSVVTCPYARSDDCNQRFGGDNNERYTIRDYRASDGDDAYSIANDVSMRAFGGLNAYESIHSDDYVRGTSTGTEDFFLGGTTEGLGDAFGLVRGDAFFIITGNDLESGSQSSITAPRNVQYAVKKYLTPVNFGYGVNGEILETKQGEFSGELQTLNFAQQINEACNRDTDVSECNITLTFSSETGGKITILQENDVLEIATIETPVQEEPVDDTPVDETPADDTPVDDTPTGDTPTNGGTPSQEEPVADTPTGGVITETNTGDIIVGGVIILSLGGFLFYIFRGKKLW